MLERLFGICVLLLVPVVVCRAGIIQPESELLSGGRLVYEAAPAKMEYRLVLSSIKKINNQWRAEKEQKLVTVVDRNTYQLSDLLSFREARESLTARIAGSRDLQLAYFCEGLDCGSSNGMAIEVLKVKQLYGLDNYQYYAVVEGLNAQGKKQLVVLYLVQRGNKRIYLQQDTVFIEGEDQLGLVPDAKTLQSALSAQGYFVLSGFSAEEGAPQVPPQMIDSLTDMLRRNAGLSIRIVGHDYDGGDLQAQIKRSTGYAEVIREALVEKGIAENRMTAHGVGSLAPVGERGQARVEVIRAD